MIKMLSILPSIKTLCSLRKFYFQSGIIVGIIFMSKLLSEKFMCKYLLITIYEFRNA